MLVLSLLFEAPFFMNIDSRKRLANRTKSVMSDLKQNVDFNKLIGHYKSISGYDKNKLGNNIRDIIKNRKMRFFQTKLG